MTRKKLNNKFIEIKPDFESILVCGNRESCPFIQVLIQEPENIDSQNLGTLIGVFEVIDESEDSSYIVNYLVSIIKKEYFSKPKRGPIESLEASLHKANLALSNLAEHGNISWLGKLNALIAVTEKNGLHLSQAGNASAFLLRSKILTDISEGLSPGDSEPNPLKTFVNVSSGRMEKNDKLIVTTSRIFDIFSLEEIKKSALRFSKKEFVQFLRTALGNELDRVAVLITDFDDKEIPIKKNPIKKSSKQSLNAFSSEAFKEKSANKDPDPQIEDANLNDEIKRAHSEFIDEKTGHIYIKEDLYADTKYENEHAVSYQEKVIDFLKNAASSLTKNLSALKNIPPLAINKGKDCLQKYIEKRKSSNPDTSLSNNISSKPDIQNKKKLTYESILSERNKRLFASLIKKTSGLIRTVSSRITPSFERMKRIVLKMDYPQKLYGLLVLILIFIVPIFIAKFLNEKAEQKNIQPIPEVVDIATIPLEKDINVKHIENIENVFSTDNDILDTIRLNERIYAITNKEIVDIEKNIKFSFPQDFDVPAYAREMNDLNLIFFINKNKRVISFSPTSKDFQENSISIPGDAQISAMGTYLTYLYLVDSKNNQIYRYPRSEGGFGEKTNWLKESFDLSNIVDFSINESVFIAKNDSILRIFKGKRDSFQVENTATPIEISKIFIDTESSNTLILDKANSRIIYLNKEGQILKQYYNLQIQNSHSIILNEKNNLIYISIEKGLKSISLN